MGSATSHQQGCTCKRCRRSESSASERRPVTAWQRRCATPAALPPANNPTSSPQALKQRLQQQLLEAAGTQQCLELCAASVQQAAQELAACQDAVALRAAFEQAASAYAPQPPAPCSNTPSSSPDRPSPFRVPQRKRKAPPTSAATADTTAAPAAAVAATGPGPQPAWSWSSVQQLVVFGSGSLGEYLGPQAAPRAGDATTTTSSSSSSSARGSARAVVPGENSRLGYRLMQLAWVLLLKDHLLPGLGGTPPLLFDPEFDAFDRQLLARLGCEVLQQDCGCGWRVCCPTLVYMPCCSRELYSSLLAANWSVRQLQQLCVLGTSFKSLQGSSLLFQALTARQTAEQQGELPGGLSAAGGVVEAMCPDMAAHGIGTSVHLFPPGLLQAAAARDVTLRLA